MPAWNCAGSKNPDRAGLSAMRCIRPRTIMCASTYSSRVIVAPLAFSRGLVGLDVLRHEAHELCPRA